MVEATEILSSEINKDLFYTEISSCMGMGFNTTERRKLVMNLKVFLDTVKILKNNTSFFFTVNQRTCFLVGILKKMGKKLAPKNARVFLHRLTIFISTLS